MTQVTVYPRVKKKKGVFWEGTEIRGGGRSYSRYSKLIQNVVEEDQDLVRRGKWGGAERSEAEKRVRVQNTAEGGKRRSFNSFEDCEDWSSNTKEGEKRR